jgi:hypothetical protein
MSPIGTAMTSAGVTPSSGKASGATPLALS